MICFFILPCLQEKEHVFDDGDYEETEMCDQKTECDSLHFSYDEKYSAPYIQASVIPGVVPH